MVVFDVALAAQVQASASFDVGIDVEVIMQLDGGVTPGTDAAGVVELFALDVQVVASQYFAVVAVVDAQALLLLVVNAEVLGAADLSLPVV
ncbi:hypothetical protein SALWKB12_0550 [Snodgrassella communis]|nr:hypothetical protein SALWKB12_2118 [Snodgrassella communis]KDN11805.1 hypothetical protein SALWKB12_1727 [Snodgrassella communis]KDN11972.1 hypothetical protein SALWKB12_1894 [Snodgrassella communis]KDN13695.1 hypothetical protein SALWKB12_0550 [Snodgrassella communis]